MRVVLLCCDPHPSTIGDASDAARLRGLAAALLRAGHEVVAIVPGAGNVEEVAPLRERGLELRDLRLPSTEREIDWHLSRVQPDLVLERFTPRAPEGALAAAAAAIPHVYDAGPPAPALKNGDLADVARAATARGLEASQGVLVASEAVAARLRSLVARELPALVAPGGTGREFLEAPDAARVARLARTLRLGAGEFRVGWVGPLDDADAALALAVAVRSLSEARVRIVAIHEGPARNALLRAGYDQRVPVTLCGAVPAPALPLHLALCDAVVVAPGGEGGGAPAVLFEAMAAGRAVVALGGPALAGLVRDGRDALLAAPRDAQAIGAALRRLTADPGLRILLGAEARRTAERRFSWDAVTDALLEFVHALGPRQHDSCGA